MITFLLILLGIVVLVLVVGGLFALAFTMFTDADGDPFLKGMGALFGALAISIVLVVIGVFTGEVSLEEAVPDGCYQVVNKLEAIPAGKTPIFYNDRTYIHISCPGQ